MTNYRILLTTTPSAEEANRIATALVERRLAACVNISAAMQSVYRWKDAIEQSQEFLLLIKTDESHTAAVESAIRELHSYELPECVVLPILAGSAEYLAWLDESLRPE